MPQHYLSDEQIDAEVERPEHWRWGKLQDRSFARAIESATIAAYAAQQAAHPATGGAEAVQKGGFFAFDPETGFDTYDTADEARDVAQSALDLWREVAQHDGEWSEEVEYVCWGRVIGGAESFKTGEDRDGDPTIDYRLAALASPAVKEAPAVVPAGDAVPPLTGRWHHGDGVLVSGSIRIAQWDCDTAPPKEFRERMLDWMCGVLNAAVDAYEEFADESFALTTTAPALPAVKEDSQGEAVAWRCFHCDETFTTTEAAREHFGKSEYQQPGCQIDVAEYRRMEDLTRSYREEDTDLHRAIFAAQSAGYEMAKRAEEAGYARGLEDAKKHPEELGLTPLATPPTPAPAPAVAVAAALSPHERSPWTEHHVKTYPRKAAQIINAALGFTPPTPAKGGV